MIFVSQMLDLLAERGWYYFLDGIQGIIKYHRTQLSRIGYIYMPLYEIHFQMNAFCAI